MPVKKKRKSSGSAAAAADDTGLKKCKLGRYRLAAGRGGAGPRRLLPAVTSRASGRGGGPLLRGRAGGGPAAPHRSAPRAPGLRHPFVRRPPGPGCLGFAAGGGCGRGEAVAGPGRLRAAPRSCRRARVWPPGAAPVGTSPWRGVLVRGPRRAGCSGCVWLVPAQGRNARNRSRSRPVQPFAVPVGPTAAAVPVVSLSSCLG